jgi:hypothetical protein
MRTNSRNVELIADDTPSASSVEGDSRKPRVAPELPALGFGQLGDVIEQLTTDATPLPSLQNRHASQLNSGGNAASQLRRHQSQTTDRLGVSKSHHMPRLKVLVASKQRRVKPHPKWLAQYLKADLTHRSDALEPPRLIDSNQHSKLSKPIIAQESDATDWNFSDRLAPTPNFPG